MRLRNVLPALALALALFVNLAWAQPEPKAPNEDGPRSELDKPEDSKAPEDSKDPSSPKKRPVPKPKIPASSEGMTKLAGKWVADSDSFGKIISSSLQKSAGATTKFGLDGIKGNYVATIDPDAKKIVVEWLEWSMQGTAINKAAGELKMTTGVSGRQVYGIKSITDGEKPANRRILIEMEKDSAIAKTTFRGIPIKSQVQLPKLGSGQWSIADDRFYLLSDGKVLEFTRSQGDGPK